MPANELLRPTLIVADMEAAVDFYTGVFGWAVIFDQVIKVDRRFPPAAPHDARSRVAVFQIALLSTRPPRLEQSPLLLPKMLWEPNIEP